MSYFPAENHFQGFDKLEVPQVRERLVISRHWNHPEIKVRVDREMISIFVDVESFVEAINQEIDKHPALIFTRKQMSEILHAAARSALEKTKEATAQVM